MLNKSSDMPVPAKVTEAAKESADEVQVDLAEKLNPALEGMSESVRKMLLKSACAMASKVTGMSIQPTGGPQSLQALAFALTALNAYRESKGDPAIRLEGGIDPAVLTSIMDEAMSDPDFLDFMEQEAAPPEGEGEVEGEEEGQGTEVEIEIKPGGALASRKTFMEAM